MYNPKQKNDKFVHRKKKLTAMELEADSGDAQAQFMLGLMYYQGSEELEQDDDNAFKWLQKAAKQEHTEAQYYLGQIYLDSEIDYIHQAVKWFNKATQLGLYAARHKLGEMFQTYQEAAAKANPEAQYILAIMYRLHAVYSSYDTEENDRELSMDYLKKSADNGYARAQYILGILYREGKEVEQNYDIAFNWFLKAAKQEHAKAQYNLGLMYKDGEGAEQDYDEAFQWFLKAAEGEHDEANYNLGLMYKEGKGVNQDYYKAIKCFQKVTDREQAKAKLMLGIMYYSGLGVNVNEEKAWEYFQAAAAQNDAVVLYTLGVMFLKDTPKTQRELNFQEDAIKGDTEGEYAYTIVDLDEESRDIPSDYSQAFACFEYAADQEHQGAQYNLGLMYEFGIHIARNFNKAFDLFKKAADQKHVGAIFKLGKLFQLGSEAEDNISYKQNFINVKTAVKWYKKATTLGHPDAQHCLNFLQHQLKVGNNKSLAKPITRKLKSFNLFPDENVQSLEDSSSSNSSTQSMFITNPKHPYRQLQQNLNSAKDSLNTGVGNTRKNNIKLKHAW